MHGKKTYASIPRDPFAYVAFWQFMTFIMLVLLVWVYELRDAPVLFFGVPPEIPDYIRGSLMTAAVFFAAVITIGNTYLQQKRVLNSLLSVCSSCQKIRVRAETWKRIDDYLRENSLLSFTHGLCPDCEADMINAIRKRKDKEHQS